MLPLGSTAATVAAISNFSDSAVSSWPVTRLSCCRLPWIRWSPSVCGAGLMARNPSSTIQSFSRASYCDGAAALQLGAFR